MSTPIRVLKINAKCGDMCSVTLLRQVGNGHYREGPFEGYMPRDLKLGGGDYISLEIDVSTGKIIGWDETAARAVEQYFKDKADEEDAANITAALIHR